jgi:hypothetical protein
MWSVKLLIMTLLEPDVEVSFKAPYSNEFLNIHYSIILSVLRFPHSSLPFTRPRPKLCMSPHVGHVFRASNPHAFAFITIFVEQAELQ